MLAWLANFVRVAGAACQPYTAATVAKHPKGWQSWGFDSPYGRVTPERYEETCGEVISVLRSLKGNRLNYSESLERIMQIIMNLTEEQEKELDEMAKKFAKTKGGK